jgi:signal transduction histidine kinase/ligand-binding sensor domain-containing protein
MRINRKINNLTAIACPVQSILILFVLVFFSACTQYDRRKTKEVTQDTVLYPRITILADLPDSNTPDEIFLEKMPKPLIVGVPVTYNNNPKEQAINDAKRQRSSPPLIHSFLDTLTHLPVEADAQGKGFFTTYNSDNGLALDQVYCGYKDRNGNLWFGTNGGGASKYDGKDFVNYTTAQGLANNVVWSIAEDKGGNIWFGTDGGGVSKYDGKIFTSYTTAQGLVDDVIQSITTDKKGNLWFGALAGASKYDGHTFINYTAAQGLPNYPVKAIVEDTIGNLWFGTLGGGVCKYDGHSFQNYTKANGLSNDSIRCILQEKAGNLWFGTWGSGVNKFDGKNFTNYSTAQGLDNNTVYSIAQDKSGNIWFGTNGGGATKFDGKVFTNYSITQGLANNIIRSITEDATGYLWFGTFGGGVSKYAGKSFTSFSTTTGLSNNVVYGITKDKSGNLWFGTFGGGVCKYDGNNITNYTTRQGLVSNSIYCVAKDDMNNLWFGSYGSGVSKYDGKSFTNYTTRQGLANDIVFSILQDKAGDIWFATYDGASKYDGKSFTNYTTRQGLAGNEVFTIIEDTKGNLWFGTSDGGVTEYNGSNFTNYTRQQGLANNTVWAITEDNDGNLWFGTQEGLSVMYKETLRRFSDSINKAATFTGKLFESFTTKDGLPDNFITQVIKTNNQKLYIGTNLGICEFVPANTASGREKKWIVGKVFNSLTGYPVKDVNAGTGAMFLDSGIIWTGTGSARTGLVRFDPNSLVNSDQKFPAVVLQQVKLNNENICWNDLSTKRTGENLDSNATAPNITEEVNTFGRRLSDIERDSVRKKFKGVSFDSITKWYPVPQKLILPHRFNNISFSFNAIETAKNSQVKYQYMLDGYDNDWNPPDNKTSAVFGNIYEGNYTFKLKAQNAEGAWSDSLNYSFKVLPPWWRTWWMYLIYATLIIATGILIFSWNNRRIIHQKKILEKRIAVATKQIMQEKETVEAQNKKIETTLTELRSAQAQLIQSEKMASLGELTAGIAHEIQNPLNFVNNFSDVNKELLEELKEEADKGNIDEVKAIANDVIDNEEKINQHGKRADSIVKGMLEHSRTSTGNKELTDINKLAHEFLRLTYHGLRVKNKAFDTQIRSDFDESIGSINVVPQDIGRVLFNLFNNALYAVIEKKKELGENYDPIVSVSTKKINGKIEIRVKDNGSGIPRKIVDKIFQPFFTTKPTGQGTGLGLSLAYDIIKAHGGEIKVETSPAGEAGKDGEGSEFIIQLPHS